MAIMWDAPTQAAALEEIAAEVAWRYWLMQALSAPEGRDAEHDEQLVQDLLASTQPPSPVR